jgi:hypothetical protein
VVASWGGGRSWIKASAVAWWEEEDGAAAAWMVEVVGREGSDVARGHMGGPGGGFLAGSRAVVGGRPVWKQVVESTEQEGGLGKVWEAVVWALAEVEVLLVGVIELEGVIEQEGGQGWGPGWLLLVAQVKLGPEE